MIWYFLLLASTLANAETIAPQPFPVFLRAGFSSVLEFEESPTKVVLGDNQKFQVERLEHSLVIKALSSYASTNMFVYFRENELRIFLLTASEDAQPTYYKKFDPPIRIQSATQQSISSRRVVSFRDGKVLSAEFDKVKDYLNVELELHAGGKEPIKPNWSLARLVNGTHTLAPTKLWAERKEVQKDSKIRVRLAFAKPNVSRDLASTSIVIPLLGRMDPISISLKGGNR